MGLTADVILRHPKLFELIRQQSRALLDAYEGNTRLASVFATQQRWLLGHAALALHFGAAGGPRTAMTLTNFLDVVARHGIASRNTADVFMKEMLHYGFALPADPGADRRLRPMVPSQVALQAIEGWVVIHLATLDRLDEGGRVDLFRSTPGAMHRLHPAIAHALLAHPAVREPQKTFSLFTWLNNGGLLMDWLISGMGDTGGDHGGGETGRISTAVFSTADMAVWLKLSRTHLNRKLREAEAMGSLGWSGPRGNSAMWVSRDFLNEIAAAQATKLAVIDAAFTDTLGTAAA